MLACMPSLYKPRSPFLLSEDTHLVSQWRWDLHQRVQNKSCISVVCAFSFFLSFFTHAIFPTSAKVVSFCLCVSFRKCPLFCRQLLMDVSAFTASFSISRGAASPDILRRSFLFLCWVEFLKLLIVYIIPVAAISLFQSRDVFFC